MRRLFVLFILAVLAFTFVCPEAFAETRHPIRKYKSCLLNGSETGNLNPPVRKTGWNWWRVLYPSEDDGEIRFYSSVLTWIRRWTRGGNRT